MKSPFALLPVRRAWRVPIAQAESKPMSACHQFRQNTCCNRTHTDVIKRRNLFTAAARFNGACRQAHSHLNCMACHGEVGTGALRGVCPHLCDTLYAKCGEEYYSAGADGSLMPCYGNAVLCSQLNLIVKNGRELCDALNVPVAERDVDDDDDLLLLLDDEDEEDEDEDEDEDVGRGSSRSRSPPCPRPPTLSAPGCSAAARLPGRCSVTVATVRLSEGQWDGRSGGSFVR